MTAVAVVAGIAAALLLLAWVLYPGLVVLLARVVGRPERTAAPGSPLPSVTCVLATRDAAPTVADRVADFLASEYPPHLLSVVVAVDATAPEVLEALNDLRGARGGPLADERVEVVAGDAPGGKCPALNAGVRRATGELLAFSDSRQRFEPATIQRLAAALLSEPRLGATSGRLLLPRDERSSIFRHYLRFELAIRRAESRLHSAVGVSGSVYAMRRALWRPLPSGLILDDVYVPMKLVLDGWRVGFVHEAIAHETRQVAPEQEYRRKVRTLTGNFQLCAWLPGVLVPGRNPIWVQFVCHKLLRLATPWCAIAVALASGVWILRAAGNTAIWLVGAALLGAVWIAIGRDVVARKLRGAVVQVGALQAAAATATINGIRGRWDVWKA